MPRVSTQSINSIFITTSIVKDISELAKILSLQARQAYTNRDFSGVLDRSEKLLNLTPKHEPFGVYYKALALSNLGDTTIADSLFEKLIDSQSVSLKAASLLALGLRNMQAQKYEFATKLIGEANALALSDNICAPLTAIYAQNAMSVILGANNESKQSLKVLEGVEPLVKIMGSAFPMLIGQHLNAQAYENFQLGNIELASHLIKKALRLPISARYPEWQQTADELLIEKPSRSFVPVKKSNVLQFPIRKSVEKTGQLFFRYESQNYRLREMSTDKIGGLCQWIDATDPQIQPEENQKRVERDF